MPRAIVLNPSDNVATLLDSGSVGDACVLQGERSGEVTLRQDVPFGHKVCIAQTPGGAEILKYGQVIGTARTSLAVGEHAHVHNIDSTRGRGDLNTR
ncbi:flagellar protein FlgA [Pandoraea terrae]|uniref:Flagellar protein FlgA n=1 Tax=Pandoraea terrae TaxID=1537710 RepID=A0A5E4S9L5_9BURK|nr:UxaA family hydrolase [Pandoraea terrae]VVD72317.1 flagellar protein FlgA [Pandoraea terrae]